MALTIIDISCEASKPEVDDGIAMEQLSKRSSTPTAMAGRVQSARRSQLRESSPSFERGAAGENVTTEAGECILGERRISCSRERETGADPDGSEESSGVLDRRELSILGKAMDRAARWIRSPPLFCLASRSNVAMTAIFFDYSPRRSRRRWHFTSVGIFMREAKGKFLAAWIPGGVSRRARRPIGEKKGGTTALSNGHWYSGTRV